MVQRVSKMQGSQGARGVLMKGMAQGATCHKRSVFQWNRSETGLRKNDKKSAQTDHYHPQSPSEATPSSPGARSRGQGRNV
jgi:hypothetical protein